MKAYKNTSRKIEILCECLDFSRLLWNPCPEKSKNYGFSKYKGVLIKWGSKDINSTILDLLDDLDIYTHERLLGICECRGGWSFLWKNFVPKDWKGRRVVEASNGDICIWKVQQYQDEQYYYNENITTGGYVYSSGNQ